MTTALILLLVSDSVARVVLQETLEHAGYSVMATGNLGTAVKRGEQVHAGSLDNQPLHSRHARL